MLTGSVDQPYVFIREIFGPNGNLSESYYGAIVVWKDRGRVTITTTRDDGPKFDFRELASELNFFPVLCRSLLIAFDLFSNFWTLKM